MDTPLALRECLLCVPSAGVLELYAANETSWPRTLQFLHRHTKFASPLLPDCSLDSSVAVSLDVDLKAGDGPTKRLTDTQFGCVSRHDVHWTLNV